MKKVSLILCACTVGITVITVPESFANGVVGGPGSDCAGQSCRDRINDVTVSCDEVSKKASIGSSNNPGGTCGSCYWGGGIAQACGSSAAGQSAAE